jgi:hypothetical protein
VIALSTTAPVPWSPPWAPERKFLFTAGSVVDRANLEAELAGELRAGRVFDFQLDAAFEAGVTELLGAEDAERLREVVAAEREGGDIPAAERAMLDECRSLMKEHWPPFRALAAQAERRNQLVPVVALRRFCTGWDGPGLPPFERKLGVVTDAALVGLDFLTARAAGLFAYGLLYAGGQEKNSAPPSPSGNGRSSSNSPRRAGGSSTAKSGRTTRSSRARSGRSKSSTSGSTAGATPD